MIEPASPAPRRGERPAGTRLAVLDPGHFHAALMQKRMYDDVDPVVRVYAPEGPELADYVRRVEAFNNRGENPTRWRLRIHTGADYLDRLVAGDDADVVVIAGNNHRKTEYIVRCVGAGMHTLADKPMAIDAAGFLALEAAFATARTNKALLCDIMTERHEITSVLQREFARVPAVFGELDCGTLDDPAVTMESVHCFSKKVSGMQIVRPAWFFDVAQQGEGLVDITTHLVDLVQWACFPGTPIDYRKDVRVLRAKRSGTALSAAQFTQVTGDAAWPPFLRKDLRADGKLAVYANGRIDYALRGVHARVSVRWDFDAPPGAGDSHHCVMRGTRASLVVRQGAEQHFVPTLYLEPHGVTSRAAWDDAVGAALPHLRARCEGIDIRAAARGFEVVVPGSHHVGHEAHFGRVTEDFLRCVKAGALPAWEAPCMIAKYYTTTQALALAAR